MRTIHVYRAAHNYFVDGIYWGDDEEGVRFYLRVTGVPPDEITKALEQIAQEGTSMIQQGGGEFKSQSKRCTTQFGTKMTQ